MTTIFLDVAPVGGAVGIAAAAVFLLIFIAIAFVVFKLLKKTASLAFRIAIVGIILLIAVAGSISFWWIGSGNPPRPERPRPTQPK